MALMQDLLTIPQVAQELGVDQSTINRRIRRGALVPSGWLGRIAYFTREDVKALKRGDRPLRETVRAGE